MRNGTNDPNLVNFALEPTPLTELVDTFAAKNLAALKKSNMTHEPIVMWLGNSSSQPQVIPWSSINRLPDGAPKPRVTGSSSKELAKSLHESREHAKTSLSWRRSTTVAALRLHSRHPQSKKNGGSGKKKKKGAQGPQKKNKNGGKKKPKKGLRKQHGGKGHPKQKGRKKAKESSRSPEVNHPKGTTREHRRHRHSSGWRERSHSGKRTTISGHSERDKADADSKRRRLVLGGRKPKRNPSEESGLPGKATREPNERNKHTTAPDHGTEQSGDRRHQGKKKPEKFNENTEPVHGGRHRKHQTPHHGRPPQASSPHHGKQRHTHSSSPDKEATASSHKATTTSLDKTSHKHGVGQVAEASSRSPSRTSSTVTPPPKTESSKPIEATSQGPIEKRGKPLGSSSTAKPTDSPKTHATKSFFSGSRKDGTGSSGGEKSGTPAEVTTAASKTNSDVTSLSAALRRHEEARKDSDKTAENDAAQTKRPEAKADQAAPMSPVPALLTGGGSMSPLFRTIPVKAPEASTSKSRR
ncbi:hypothetical protein HPB52_002453 [Rhipicephalus sanguineus]|uniref:Uncharacterized protein n=1 Tax=Rhipicephalus sanguineus TaxID=34632 RepID=A0A9D4PBE6_RHISA|nr:hypothetical protein HPB52_002453 [Rhipicephalus sanguineus]